MADTESISSSKGIIKDGGDSEVSLPLVISIVALVLAVIGLNIAAVAISQKTNNNVVIGAGAVSSAQVDNADPKPGRAVLEDIWNNDDDKIWTMGIGHDASRWEYLDEVSGQIKGFDVDIINAVCKIAGKSCRLTADIYQNCWNSQVGQTSRGGDGLFGGYYDACTAWQNSYVRSRTFGFTKPFAKALSAGFVVKPGNPRGFDWRDITGKKIGFIDGFVNDEYCIERLAVEGTINGGAIPAENIFHYQSREALVAALLAEDIDAGFDNAVSYSNADLVEIISDVPLNCVIDGFGMMMRKDSRLWEWWDPALETLMATYEYRLICNDLLEQHSDIPGPDPEDLCIGLSKPKDQ